MHSYCLIPGMHSTIPRPRETGELDKHPAWKLRKANGACGNRLSLKLEQLDMTCRDITARITHSINALQNKLKESQKTPSLPKKSSQESIRKYPHSNNYHKVRYSKNKRENNIQDHKLWKKNKIDGPSLRLKYSQPVVKATNRYQGDNDSNHSEPIQQSKRPCYFGATHHKTDCTHFPCIQPDTYHSVGFRVDLPSKEWLSWEDLIKAKWNQSGLRNFQKDSGTSLMRWCSLPTDFESRKERLFLEISKRRNVNETKKPPSWATNYGKLTPYKTLSSPIRPYILHGKA